MNDKIILNEEQKRAVEHGKGPLLIIAGAGTGKTTVITERIKWLISKEKAQTSEILALTFTEKASREMEERVDIAMPYGYTQMWIMTFHSFCDRILRNEAVQIGIDPGYRLMTEAESIKFFRDNLFKFDLKYFRPLGNPNKFIESILVHFSRLRDEDVEPTQYIPWARTYKSEEIIDQEKYLELAKAYKKYEELKIKEGVMDFADLISSTLTLFRKRNNILKQYQEQFKYVLIDEFQDTNIAQYELVKLLTPNHGNPNLTVCGDDSQSIYKFRGAAVSNILSFKTDYPNTQMVLLTKNYRSTQEILDRAYMLIKFNDPDTLEAKLGISKKLISERKLKGEKINFIYTDRVEDEADEVIKKIKELAEKEKREWLDFAILVRANNHSEPFIRALVRQGIPYQFLGPGMLYRQPEIKELIAYLKTLYNPEDSTSFYKVLSSSIFSVPGRDLVSLTIYARKYNLSLFEAAEKLVSYWFEKKDLGAYGRYVPFIEEKNQEIFKKIVFMIRRHLDLTPKETAGQILYYFLEDTGLLQKMVTVESEKEEQRTQNISKFFDKLKTYEAEHEDASIQPVVDWLDLSMELGESPLATNIDWSQNNAVNILTVHSSKGLEFPVVILVNLVSQRFPSLERRERIPIPDALVKEELPEGDYHLEEERRLFYVGMTRARDSLYFSAANYYGEGKREKKISPFVIETLGEREFKKITQPEEAQLSLFSWKKTPQDLKTVIRQPVSYLSYTQIQTFQTCPLHYKLRYILKIPTATTAALSFGTTIHAALRDFYQSLIAGSSESLLSFYEKNWIAEGFNSRNHELLMKAKGEKYLRDYLEKNFNKKNLPVALEVPFRFSLLPSLRIGGKIDRVDKLEGGKIEVVDYKTGERVPNQKEIDKNLQMTLYGLAATEVKDELFWKKPEEVILSLYYFDQQLKISTTRTKEQLQQAKQEVIKIAHEIETSEFNCNGGAMCRNCEYKLYCEVR